VDADERKIGEKVGELSIEDFEDLERIVKERQIAIGIIATPAHAAQDAADRLVASGVKSVLNFAPAVLQVPDDVLLRKVDLSIELQILSFYEQRKSALDSVRRGKRLMGSAAKSTRP
jgi:redox-sensing transcriptional repressor